MASKKWRKLQVGLEATKGTAVAATAVLRVAGTIEDQTEVTFADEDVGIIGGTDRSYIAKKGAELKLDDTPATFEQLPILLSMGLDDVVTGAADGAGTDKIYDYVLATTTEPGFKTYTIEGGDDQQAEEMEYAFAQEIVLKGAMGEAFMMSATIVGRQVTDTTFTGAISVAAVEDILFSSSKFYIDAIGGTIGTTQVTQTLLDAELTIDTGLRAVPTADGQLYFTFAKRVEPEVVLKVTMEFNGSSVAERANWRSQTARLIQIKSEGSTVATPGTTYSKKTLIINLAGKWEKFEKIDEQDGNDVVKATFRARYNTTAAKQCQIIVVNEKTSIP